MKPMRRNAVVAGVLFIIATGASLLSGPLLASLDDSDYLVSIAAYDVRVEAGAVHCWASSRRWRHRASRSRSIQCGDRLVRAGRSELSASA